MNLMRKKLPVAQSDFRVLQTEGYLYVDKTNYIYELLTSGRQYYFLARPRRFGKSLFVSTLDEVLKGNRALFTDLAIANSDYDWQPHGVIKLDFSLFKIKQSDDLNLELSAALKVISKQYQLDISFDAHNPAAGLREIVTALHQKFGRVGILIDEYDSPIVSKIQQTAQATQIRDDLQVFFRNIKGLGALINFVFMTGVTSFSKAGLFSGLNNLQILSLESPFGAICGYTEAEVEQNFAPYLATWAAQAQISLKQLKTQIKTWYNGYHFGKHTTAVYNPFSLTNAIYQNSLENYWITSGAPTFLIDELKQQYRKTEYRLIEPEKFTLAPSDLGAFDIGAISLPVLMFQTGYLTITAYDQARNIYYLGYPNNEVRTAALQYLLTVFTDSESVAIRSTATQLWDAWNDRDLDTALMLLQTLFAKIPYAHHIKLEKFYHSLFQMICNTAGIETIAEQATSHGSIDSVMKFPKVLYVVELKFNSSAAAALAQIKSKRYYEQFLDQQKPIVLLGLNFEKTAGHFALTFATEQLTGFAQKSDLNVT